MIPRIRRIAYDELSMKQWLVTMTSVGAVIGAFLIAVGAYIFYQRSSHASAWTPVQATISGTSELCHMSRKAGKRWVFVEAIECSATDAYIAAHPNSKWRSTHVDYATIDYAINGEAKTQRVPQHRVSLAPVVAGTQSPIYVNPANTDEFDRPIAAQDFDDAIVMAYFAIAIIAGLFLFGGLLGWLSERKRSTSATTPS